MIKTKRLILRPWLEEDLEPFAKMNADLKVREFFPSTLAREESDAQALLFAEEIGKHGFGFWAVSIPGVAPFAGFIGLGRADSPIAPAVDIGWRLAHLYWGKGYATEGALAALQYGFEVLHLEEIVAFTAIQNRRSRRVMEKIGMGHDPKGDFDHPKIATGHPLRRQVLYRKTKGQESRQ